MSKISFKGTIDTINEARTKGIMSTQIAIRDIVRLSKIDNKINRDLSYNRLPSLLKYFEKADSELGIYLPALVFSYRGNPIEKFNRGTSTLELDDSDMLIIIDGQHRIKAMEKYIEKLTGDSELYNKFIDNFLTAQIYFGLSEEDERKLFSDINSNARRVSMSLVTQYDSRDIMNLLIQELYRSTPILKVVQVELNKSKIIRPSNQAFTTGARLKYFISYFLFGKKTPSRRDEQNLKEQYDEIVSYLSKFFAVFFSALPKEPGDVLKYVLGHEPVQNALALYLNTVIIVNETGSLSWKEDWETEVEQLDTIDWSIRNNVWDGWSITVNPVRGSYKGIIETATPEITEYIIESLG